MLNLNFRKNNQLLRASILLAMAIPSAIWAGATLDGSTSNGVKTEFTDTNFVVDETHGTLTGSNLFHSFNDFNINAGESATFTGTSSINNVVSRVTGGTESIINGQLTSTSTGANFYFINPSSDKTD